MIATSHVLIAGAAAVAVGSVSQNPVLALSVGVTTHFLCDLVPHLDFPPSATFIKGEIVWDGKLYTFAIIDSLLAMFLTLFIWLKFFSFPDLTPYALGSFGGYLPDLLDNFPLWRQFIHSLPGFRQFHKFHHWIHQRWMPHFPMPQHWKLGIATQIVAVLPCLWYLTNR